MIDRIQKIISGRGVASRRQAEKMIEDGRVTCNGAICMIGQSADPDTDVIAIDGIPLPSVRQKIYIMLNKPRGYVTTLSDEKGRRNVSQLVADCQTRVYPVGRLDMDSEGLLLLTNDGDFANYLMHPKHEVEKVYLTTVKGFTLDKLIRLQKPVILDGYQIRPPKVEVISNAGDPTVLRITIHEGRNRQVRRMCAIAGMDVQRLVRIKEGSLALGGLTVGKWRYLSNAEVQNLTR